MLKDCIEGILIDKTPFKDKSLIIRVLEENGELYSGLFYEGTSKLSLQYLNSYQFLVAKSPGKGLGIFKEIHFLHGRSFHFLDPILSDQYFVIAELCRILFREEDPGRDIFTFLDVELRYFSGSFNPDFHILFLAKLITLYGYMPERPYEGCSFDFREGFFMDHPPGHPDYCDAGLIRLVFDFVNGNSPDLDFSNGRDRYSVFIQLLRFLELQKGIKISLKSIEILREIRD